MVMKIKTMRKALNDNDNCNDNDDETEKPMMIKKLSRQQK